MVEQDRSFCEQVGSFCQLKLMLGDSKSLLADLERLQAELCSLFVRGIDGGWTFTGVLVQGMGLGARALNVKTPRALSCANDELRLK